MKKLTKKQKFLNFIAIFLIVVCGLIATCNITCLIKAEINYKHNIKAWNDYGHTGIINDQADFKNIKFGFGDVDMNGCGAVSVYNILVLEGRYVPLYEIVHQYDMCGENVFGLGGSRPSMVVKTLKNYGFDVSYTFNKANFEKMAINSKYAIYVYFGCNRANGFFGHYQLMYDFDGAKFKTINITGKYTFGKITTIPNTLFEMMIVVNY